MNFLRRLRSTLMMLTLLHAGAAAAADGDCELHVWAAVSTGASNSGVLSNLGVAGALTDYHRNKDINLRDQAALIDALTPVVQAQTLSSLDLPTLIGATGARVIFHVGGTETRTIGKVAERRTSSSSPCYVELFVSGNVYHKSTVHGRLLASGFTYKDFRGGRARARILNGSERHALTRFPPVPGDEIAARDDLKAALTENLRSFVADIRKKQIR